MSGLVEFLRARLDEDEEAARNATEGPWFADHPEPKHWGDDPESALIVQGKVLCILDNQYNGPLNADHIVRHQPTRVLAEVEAKRFLVAGCESALAAITEASDTPAAVRALGPVAETLRRFARAYCGHPDYREEWKP